MSSSINTYTTSSGSTAIAGLVSGIDTSSLVDQLVDAESTKLTTLQQQLQLAEWKQEAYRTLIAEVQTFVDTYFSSTGSSSLIKQSNYLQFTATSSDTSSVTVSAGVDADDASHTITVSQLATAETLSSSSAISAGIEASSAVTDYSSLDGESFAITVDGTEYTVTIDSSASITDADSLVTTLQDAIDDAVGDGKVTVTADSSGILSIAATDDSGVQSISIADGDTDGVLDSLGFDDDSVTSNRIDTSSTLSEISAQLGTAMTFVDDNVVFSINGTSFTFSEDDTLDDVMDEINDADVGATLEYDELNDKLVLTADDTGAGAMVTASDTSGTFISTLLGTTTAGVDAKVTIDGVTMTRSSNSIEVDDVTYTLNAVTTDTVTVDVAQDTDAIYDLISNFVDAYNTLIADINDQLDADYDSDYAPLTEDEEAEMSDTEIEKWNAKAQTGLLSDDSLLTDMLSELRVALMDSVSGSSLSLTSLGITTGSYDEEGTLYIDEDTLTAAIEDDAAAVQALFCQKSTSYSNNSEVRTLTSSERATRYEEEGIALRFYDLISDYVSTSVDSAGNKGRLLEKAGIEDDGSNTDNSMTSLIDEYETRISAEEDRLDKLAGTLGVEILCHGDGLGGIKFSELLYYLDDEQQQLIIRMEEKVWSRFGRN